MQVIEFWEPVRNASLTDDPTFTIEEPLERASRRIKEVLSAGHPVLLAYSSGKDSSTLVSITLTAAKELIDEGEIVPPILVLHSNTGVEQPIIAKLAQAEMQRMMKFAKKHSIPLTCHTSHPELYDTFGVRVIGGRALPAFPDSRADCSTSWKILPNQRTMRRVLNDLGQSRIWAEPVVMTGVRQDESIARDQRIAARGEVADGLWRNEQGHLRLSPILDWDSDSVWEHIGLCNAGERESYSDFSEVMGIYTASGGDSCVIVADMKSSGNRKPCGTRTGCFLCTRIGEDRSFHNMIDSDRGRYGHLKPLAALRDFVYALFPPFTALKIYFEVMDGGDLRTAPDVPRFPKTDVPRIGKIHVGTGYADGLKGQVSGLRNVCMEMHHESCGFDLRTLNDGSIVIDVETDDAIKVDEQGAAEFLCFVAEDKIREYCHHECSDWTYGFQTYIQYGTITLSKGRSSQCQDILQRSQWRQKHNLHGQRSAEELEARCDVLFSRQLALI